MSPQQTIAHHRITAKLRGCGHRCDLSGSSDPAPAAPHRGRLFLGNPEIGPFPITARKRRLWTLTFSPHALCPGLEATGA